MLWTPQALPWLIVAAALLILATVIFSRQRASRVAVLFCAMIVLVAAWFGAFAAMYLSVSADVAARWGRIGLAGVALLPAAIYDFTTTALRLHSKRQNVVRVVWVVAGVWAVIALFTGGLARGVINHPWGFYPAAGPLLPVFLLFFFAVLGAQLAEGIAEQRRTNDRKRKSRIGRMMIAFAVVYLSVIDFLPMFGVRMRPVGYVPVLAFIAVAWTSILRHRLAPITAARAAREILETMADALFVIDAEGCIRVVNGAVRSLLGYRQSDLLGRSIDTLEVLSGDATISRTLRELSKRGAIRDQHRLLRHKDGHPVDVSISVSPVSEVNVQEGAVVIARDIRERMRAHDELHSAMRRLEASNRELEDFAYVASHDLQEPLRKIQAFGDRLKAKHAHEMAPQARDYIDRMQAAAKRMQILINDLLTFSRVTTKAQPFVPVDLGQIAAEVTHDLELRAHDAGGEIVIGALPSIDADPLQMRQLLQNLASNALKFHRPGVPPRVEIAGATENGTRARIVVTDNGIGFDEKYAERIFTMFERLHGRGSYEGTGIGLAICRKIAERHGGEIAARSVPGEGSTFIVTLPVHHEENHA
ncbi:MAG TPA: ATP-binding protein [Thermoanaerobaculia bacterium]|nr:ATP-binding protein [Thermoanaerobaculia bacterium]